MIDCRGLWLAVFLRCILHAFGQTNEQCAWPGQPCPHRELEVLLRIVPYPRSAVVHRDSLLLTPQYAPFLECQSATGHSRVLGSACQHFLTRLRRLTGDPAFPSAPIKSNAPCTSCQIRVRARLPAPELVGFGEYPELGVDESYTLNVTQVGVVIDAATPFGAAHALESLLQLVRPSPHAVGYVVPLCEIDDAPRLPWRGGMLDVVRHWLPLELVLRSIDTFAAAKLNVLHLHLTDDQGFRVFSESFPELTERTTQNHEFFSPVDIDLIVRHAALRGMRVVPEFDMPAHSSSWILAMPQLVREPYRLTQRTVEYGRVLPNMLDPSSNATWETLERFFDDMAVLFPDRFWHLGGDEPNFDLWLATPELVDFAQSLRLGSVEQLFSYFAQRLRSMMHARGKRMVMWEEGVSEWQSPVIDGLVHVPPPPISGIRAFAEAFDNATGAADPLPDRSPLADAVLHNWMRSESAYLSVQRRQATLVSRGFYMDFNFQLEEHYKADPLGGAPADLALLGGEAVFWTEWMTAENIEARMWPRTGAAAERFWSPASRIDFGSLLLRLPYFDGVLEVTGAQHRQSMRRMMKRIAGGRDEPALEALVSALKPLGMYPWKGSLDQTTPLVALDNAVQGGASLEAELFIWRVGEVTSNFELLPQHAPHLLSALSRWLAMRAPLLALATERTFLTEGVVEFTLHVSRIAFDAERAVNGLLNETAPLCTMQFRELAMHHLNAAGHVHMHMSIYIVDACTKLVDLYCNMRNERLQQLAPQQHYQQHQYEQQQFKR